MKQNAEEMDCMKHPVQEILMFQQLYGLCIGGVEGK